MQSHPNQKTIDEILEEMDEEDLSLKKILAKYGNVLSNKDLYTLCIVCLQINGRDLKYIPLQKFDAGQIQTIYATAVEANGLALKFIPFADTEHYWKLVEIAIKNTTSAVKYLPKPIPLVPLSDHYYRIYLKVVTTKGMALIHLPVPPEPINKQYKDIYLAAIKNDPDALMIIAERIGEGEIPSEYKDIYIAACKKSEKFLALLPSMKTGHLSKLTQEIFLAVLPDQAKALQYLPIFANQDLTDDVKTMFLHAIKLHHNCYKFIPKLDNVLEIPPNYAEVYLAGVSSNGYMLSKIPEYPTGNVSPSQKTLYETLWLTAVKQNGLALKYLPEFDEGGMYEILHIYVAAVKQNPMALQYIMYDSIKAFVIEELGLEHILNQDFSVVPYLPEDADSKVIVEKIKQRTEVLVITCKSDNNDAEIKDSFAKLSQSEKYKDKILRIRDSEVRKFLADFTPQNPLQLVFLSHTNIKSKEISGMHFLDITKLLKKHPFITSVKILGCNTFRAKPLKEEISKIAQLRTFYQALQVDACGFIVLADDNLTDDSFKKLLHSIKLAAAFILKKSNGQYTLYFINRVNPENIITRQSTLTPVQVRGLERALGGKSFKFNAEPANLRTFQKPLNKTEFNKILFIEQNVLATFSKNHPLYKQAKEIYPFLWGAAINDDEHDKILDSLMKELIIAIKDAKLPRDIVLKAFNFIIHVDLHEIRLHSSQNSAYKDKDYPQSFVDSADTNIDQAVLDDSRIAELLAFLEDQEQPAESHVKSLTTVIVGTKNDDNDNNKTKITSFSS